jgi:AraC family transcriptional regulator
MQPLEQLDPFESLGTVQVPGVRVEVRRFSRMPASRRIWTAPSNILTFRFAPRNAVWTRPISQRTEFIPSGPLTFRPRSATWETKSNGSPVLCVMAKFDCALWPTGECEAYASSSSEHACSIEDLSMIEMMRLLHDEIRAPGFASTAMVESISEVLRIKLSRLLKAPDDDASESVALGKLDIALIHDYIEAQSGRSPSVTELAKLFNISRRSLLRRFKDTTEMTVVNYITRVQLTKAKRLLATSDQLIKQIAHETGFKSPSNFALAFERNVGMTPTAFRTAALGSSRPRRA